MSTNKSNSYRTLRDMGHSHYDAYLSALQFDVKAEEEAAGADYTDEQVRRAAVHTRQDMVLLCGALRLIHGQLRWVVRLLWVIAINMSFLVLSRL